MAEVSSWNAKERTLIFWESHLKWFKATSTWQHFWILVGESPFQDNHKSESSQFPLSLKEELVHSPSHLGQPSCQTLSYTRMWLGLEACVNGMLTLADWVSPFLGMNILFFYLRLIKLGVSPWHFPNKVLVWHSKRNTGKKEGFCPPIISKRSY